MTLFWPAQGAAAPVDEYADVIGETPDEGSEGSAIKQVQCLPDPRYPTNAFLVIVYVNGQSVRFRMKKSTAEKLYQIMKQSIRQTQPIDTTIARRLTAQELEDRREDREWKRKYQGVMS